MKSNQSIRFASYNVSFFRSSEGELIDDLSTPNNEQAQNVAEIIQRNNPDVLLVNEFDYDSEGTAAQLFQENYLSVGQNGADPIEYPYVYLAPSNTGIPSGFDLNNDGEIGGPNDAYGFGFFPGQYAMVLYSKYPIDTKNIRTFQEFLWKDMPGALLPDDPSTPEPNDWYSKEELEVFRLSSKNHWDIPIQVGDETIHVLASHPTPPVFDGEEDRNGRRNHDEIRFWADYITPGEGDYIYDDSGDTGGLAPGTKFVIMGDLNADPYDGDSTDNAILQLLNNPQVNTAPIPGSVGGIDATIRQNAVNDFHEGNPAFDTADFNDSIEDNASGNLRVDYALPSQNLNIEDTGVFWPPSDDPRFDLVGDFPFPSSDHRLVYADVSGGNLGQVRQTVTGVELLGEVTFDTGLQFEDTEVGGLSGITYDSEQNIYYSISDDRASIDPARFYTLEIDLSDGSLDEGDIDFTDVTTLTNTQGEAFTEGSIDPEGIALTNYDTLYISSEGDAENLIDPFVDQFSLDGQQLNSLPVPENFLPTANQTSGIRNNLAFESLTISPDGQYLYTATENALYQDGTSADIDQGSLSRIVKYNLTNGEPVAEYVYPVEPVPEVPQPADGFATNGLVELIAIDNNGTLLALERAFSAGVGNTVRLYEVKTQGALDVSSEADLFDEENDTSFEIDPTVSKRLLVDFADLGITPDNLEGLALGPKLADGDQSLIVVSDNNFSETQTTQFIALGLDIDSTAAAIPTVETPVTVDAEATTTLAGDSDDPAIWVNPTDPADSIVIGTLKDGGLVTFNLEGEVEQIIAPEEFGQQRFNNVDIIYDFPLASMLVGAETRVDLAIASDRENDTLAIFRISENGQLEKFPTPQLDDPDFSIFGVDDGEATAYGLAAYTSPVSGKNYVFVTQASGNKIAQIELNSRLGPADELFIEAEIVRTIELPTPTGDPEDSQSEGIVVDQELGLVYVAMETEVGILKFSAEPDAGDELNIIQPIGAEYLEPDIEGLTIYYGEDGSGYLIASSQGDSSYAVFSRDTNEYLGSFIVGESGSIDQVNETDGLDVVNLPLGDAFPNGLLVVQDGANSPQNVVQDEEELENNSTNFKFVPWESVVNTLPDFLEVNTSSYNPRNPQPQSLVHGVASGDVTQTTAILWTRSTFLGEVTFEYATDPEFNNIVGTATATVDNIRVPVQVEIDDLDSGTTYYYRATDAAGDTATGEFKTAAEVGNYQGFRFGATGDWQQAPPYPSLKNADQRDLELFVRLGDTIYADLETPALPGVSQARTISDFRTKHAEILTSRFGLNTVPELYASTPILATIDDHEIVDNFAGGAAPGESPDAPDIGSDPEPLFTDEVEFVNDTEVYENALQAFQEYHPLEAKFYGETGDARTAGERQLYRYNTYGSDAAVIMLDSRSFRDAQIDPVNPTNPDDVARFLGEAYDPNRTLLGRQQVEDLKADLLDTEQQGITWKFITIPEPIQNFGLLNAEDRFEGYAAERTEILKFIDDNDIDNVVFMAGDFHGTIVNNLTYQTTPGGEQIATSALEIVTGPAAFNDGLFGPTVANLATVAGLITPEQQALYDALPVAADPDSEIDDKDDFIKQLLEEQTTPLGYDPVGLNNNLPQAQNSIDAELLQGDYVATHTFGWTEFDIDEQTQVLTVTTYGIDPYSEAELRANPEAITSREPRIVSQFVVNPQGEEITGTAGRDNIVGTPGKDIIGGSQGRDLVTGGAGADEFVYNSVVEAGEWAKPTLRDRLTDFQPGIDVLNLASVLTELGYEGNNPIEESVVEFISRGSSGSYLYLNVDDGSIPYLFLEGVAAADLTDSNSIVF